MGNGTGGLSLKFIWTAPQIARNGDNGPNDLIF